MRAARIVSCLFVLSGLAGELRGQALSVERINAPEVEVRSGPSMSPNYYPTGKLHFGDSVQVVRQEAGDWLAIVPPKPDSFSWVDARLVDQSGSNAIVNAPQGAPILVGSRLLNQPPSVTNCTAARGTQLLVIGKPEVTAEGNKLLPIQPPASEVRYIPKSAVTGNTTGQQIAATAATTVPPSYTKIEPPAAQTGAGGTSPLLWEAQKAEEQQNYIRAAQLYEEAANRVVNTDHDLYVRYLNYSQFLRNKSSGKVASANGSYAQAGNMDGRLIPSAPTGYGQPTAYLAAQGQAPSQYCYVADPCRTVTLRAPATTTAIPQPAVAPQQPQAQWYGPGQLFPSSRRIDDKPTYLILTGRDQAPVYLNPSPGLDLQPYCYRNVQLYGPVVYRGELRTYYMVALQVNPVQ